MNKTFSAIISILLILIITVSTMPISFAEDITARLYNIYGNGMLLKQKDEVSLNGIAKGGSEITCYLFDENNELITQAKTTANRSNEFSLKFTAPDGGYKTYSLAFYENGNGFAFITDVVFGEVWLASGQSNMQYPLLSAHGGKDMYDSGEKLSNWIRALLVPGITPYKGRDDSVPADPQKEIEGAFWVKGDNIQMYNISAVAYYFAQKLMEKIDMPVGIINASLGGSSIASWLSRESIDSDAQVKADFIKANEYYNYSDWNETERSMYYDMTSNFNLKINPVRPFKLSGMIWYQGETDAIFEWEHGRYSRAFDLMQRSYTEYFGYENGMLPIVFTSLCSCPYSNRINMLDMNLEFQEIQQTRPEARALISVYDIPLDFYESVGAIHPAYKQPIGERMAYSAVGFVYGKYDTYTTATVKNVEIKDGCVYVSFRNTGSGLNFRGASLKGFSVCGEDGVYVQANAKIVSDDTICISSPSVDNPVSASYAYFLSNGECNLCATQGKSTFIPAASFVTDKSVSTRYMKYTAWTDCESDTAWRCILPSEKSGYYNTWVSDNAEINFNSKSAYSGENGMSITTDGKIGSKKFSVNPLLTYKNKLKNVICSDFENNFCDYGAMTFMIRNNGKDDIKIQSVRIYVNDVSYYSPVECDSNDVTVTIPADGEWHKVTYNLNKLYLTGNEGGIAYSNERLDEIKNIKINFTNTKRSCADISIDEFRFTADTSDGYKTEFNPVFKSIDNPFEFISALFVSMLGLIVNIFR